MSLPLSTNRLVEVFIVDTPSAAGVALGSPRTGAESRHVLCRHVDESTPDFMHRVLRRLERIQHGRGLRSLWYVVGCEAACARSSARLLRALVPLLESGVHLTVVGPGSSQHTVLEWIDSIMDSTLSDVSVRAELYADDAEVLRSTTHRANANAAPLPVAAPATRARFPWQGGDIVRLNEFGLNEFGLNEVGA